MAYSKLKRAIQKLTPIKISNIYTQPVVAEYKKKLEFGKISYSQEGEDLIMNKLLNAKPTGFYIDIGAHHPYRFSNTYFFYTKGWNGINIDPVDGFQQLFDKERERDINLEIAIGKYTEALKYYQFEEPALNTFDEALAEQYQKQGYRVKKSIIIPVHSLADILGNYIPDKNKIDFMSIDVEGLELQVLESNDWNIFRPDFLIIELLDYSIHQKNPVCDYLKTLDYKIVAKAFNSVFFQNIK